MQGKRVCKHFYVDDQRRGVERSDSLILYRECEGQESKQLDARKVQGNGEGVLKVRYEGQNCRRHGQRWGQGFLVELFPLFPHKCITQGYRFNGITLPLEL